MQKFNLMSKKITSLVCALMLSITLIPNNWVSADVLTENSEEVVENVITSTNQENIEDVTTNTENTKEIKIFHTNDTHSRVDNFPKMEAYIKSLEEEYLLVDAGDTYHGQTFATLENGRSVAKILKSMNYDAMTPGNHDFNYGQDMLLELQNESNVPVLATNIRKNNEKLFESSLIKEVNGVKVGVIGIATPETAYKTNPVNVVGLDFGTMDSIVSDVQSTVDSLKADGAEVIVALSHLGIDSTSEVKATDVATRVEGIDVIIDGHSHSTLDKYRSFNENNTTQITSTGSYLEFIGEVTIVLDEENNILDINFDSVTSADLEAIDETVSGVISDIKEEQKEITNQVVAETPIDLNGERSFVRSGHTNLGRLITSAMLDETGADIALTNGGGIRASISAGSITKGDVIEVLPFGNYIVTKTVKGQDIVDALNFGMAELNGGFPHFAGMNVLTEEYFDEAGTKRWKAVAVEVNGSPIDLDGDYVLATNDFMAAGGDGYEMFGVYPTLNEYSALDEALISYISKVGSEGIVAIDGENRLSEIDVVELDSLEEILKEAVEAGYSVNYKEYSEEKTLITLENTSEIYAFLVNGTLDSVKDIVDSILEEEDQEEEEIIPPTENEEDDKIESDENDKVDTDSENNESSDDSQEKLPNTGGHNSTLILMLGLVAIAGSILINKDNKIA